MRILFVCSGNICRSPSAELVLRAYDTHNHFPCSSRATEPYHVGQPTDPRTLSALHTRGIPCLTPPKAQQITEADFSSFDILIGMAIEHVRFLLQCRPMQSTAKIALFLDSVPALKGQDVADPYYGATIGFAQVLSSIEQGVSHWLKLWQSNTPSTSSSSSSSSSSSLYR